MRTLAKDVSGRRTAAIKPVACVLLQMLWRLGLERTEFTKARHSTNRLKVFKVGALLRHHGTEGVGLAVLDGRLNSCAACKH